VTDIDVAAVGGNAYRVVVTDSTAATTHEVTASPAEVEALGGATPEALIEASFRFLLDREPKESIMREFDLTVISTFFPEYPSQIIEYL